MRVPRIYLLFFISLCVQHTAIGQFNDSTHHYLRYASTGIINRTTETRSFVLTNALGYSMRKKKIDLNSSTAWVYGRNNGNLSNNDFNSVLNLDYLRNVQRVYYWALTNYTTSYSLKINNQFQIGAGLGYSILKNEKASLVISDGILFEKSNVELASIGNQRYETWRNSLRVKFKFLMGSSVTLDGTSYWQPSLKDSHDYIIQSNTNLSIRLKKWLSVTSSLNYNRFARTNRENLLVNFGLVAETYF